MAAQLDERNLKLAEPNLGPNVEPVASFFDGNIKRGVAQKVPFWVIDMLVEFDIFFLQPHEVFVQPVERLGFGQHNRSLTQIQPPVFQIVDALFFKRQTALNFVENVVIALFLQTHVGVVGKTVERKREIAVTENQFENYLTAGG